MTRHRVLSIRFDGIPNEDAEDEIIDMLIERVPLILNAARCPMDFDVDGVLEEAAE